MTTQPQAKRGILCVWRINVPAHCKSNHIHTHRWSASTELHLNQTIPSGCLTLFFSGPNSIVRADVIENDQLEGFDINPLNRFISILLFYFLLNISLE